ncbi:MAG: HD domain-containing phosphohydrolase [Halanaerobiales bacterium]
MRKNESNEMHGLMSIGIEASKLLINNFKQDAFIYEKLAEYIFQGMEKAIDIDQICFYVVDDEMRNLKEEAIYDSSGWMPSYDFIPLDQLSEEIKSNELISYQHNDYYHLKVPLHTGAQLLGMMELRTMSYIDEEKKTGIKAMASVISFGLRSVLFEADTIREKENTELLIEINNKLQSISDLDKLIDTFLKLTVGFYKFDQVTVFIFNKDRDIIFARGIDEMGREFSVDEFPELPDLTENYTTIDDHLGYWFPLKTNTGIVGVVLFDNIYTLYKISDSLLNTLRTLSSQFANAIDNIRMFSSLQDSAYFDVLTGLHNRTYLEKVMHDYEEGPLPLSVIIGDLNGLKITNDVFGHGAGDNLLVQTGEIFKESCPEDAVITRWGGDEFFVFLPGKSEKEVLDICQTIKEKSEKNNSTQVQLSISLGYASRKDNTQRLKSVIKEAEDMMYRHKLLESKSYRSSIISSLKETLAEKSHESAGHGERMSILANKIGEKLGLIGSELDDLKLLAVLHDLGKVVIKDDILYKAGQLTENEWDEIKKHPEAGYRIAQASMELSHISNYILSHHEWWDGSGYPLGKKGEEIPLLSRIISVVDAYDVMTHDRPYKKAISHQEALKELERYAGKQFDAEIVRIFLELEFEK